MKKLLICVLAIAMMLSSVAFAHESMSIDFEDYSDKIFDGYINIAVENALKIEASDQNNEKSKFELVDDPKDTYGKVLKLTNPVKGDITKFPYINPTFYGTDIKNVNFGFSVYPVDNSATSDKEFETAISVKYKAQGVTDTQTLVLCRINSEKLFSSAGHAYSEKFVDKWFDLRFDIDGENKVVTTYVNGEFFTESFFAHDVNYIQRMNIQTTINGNSDEEQIAYFDNFFVNKSLVSFDDRDLKIDYTANCYVDDDFDERILANNGFKTNGDEAGCSVAIGASGSSAEDVAHGNVGIMTVKPGVEVLGKSPSIASKPISPKDGSKVYDNEEYIYEIDLKFSHFNGECELGRLSHRTEGSPSTDRQAILPAVIAENGDLNIVDSDNTTTITRLENNRWYNFKFHVKPYIPQGTKKLNNGLVADVYFMDKLVAENVLFATHKGGNTDPAKYYSVTALRHLTCYSGTCLEGSKDKLVYVDNMKYYEVSKVEKEQLNIVDLEVCNADGKLISSSYQAGNNTFTAYVTAASELKSGNVTLVAARYSPENGKLIGVDAVPAVVSDKHTLTKVTANLNVTDVQSGEFIKVLIMDSMGNLTPYTKPITLSYSAQ